MTPFLRVSQTAHRRPGGLVGALDLTNSRRTDDHDALTLEADSRGLPWDESRCACLKSPFICWLSLTVAARGGAVLQG